MQPPELVPRDEPAKPTYTPEATEPRSRPLALGGAALSLLGAFGLGAAIQGAFNADETCKLYPEVCAEAETYPKLFGAVGAPLLASGIFMMIYGAHQVPVQKPVALQLVPWASLQSGGLILRLTSSAF